MRISSVGEFFSQWGAASLRPKALRRAGVAGVLAGLGVTVAVQAQPLPAPSEAVQVSGARSAYADTILAPITPPAVPAPVKSTDGDVAGPASAQPPADARIVIKEFRFSGNTVFTSQELAAIVASEVGKPLLFSELQTLAARIQSRYHAQGYLLARVVIPQQNIGADRVLNFRILEGWLGEIHVKGAHRFSADRVRRTLLVNSPLGAPLKVSDLERGLVLLGKNSGVDASSTLTAGNEVGSTDVEVEFKEERRVTGSVEVNNFGSENTGEYRIIPAVELPNLTGRGDSLSVFGVVTPDVNDLYFAQVGYTAPLNVRGTSASVYYSQGNYQVGQEFQVLDVEGDNSGWGVGLTQDYVVSAKTSFNFEAWLESSDMEQTMLGVLMSKDEIRKIRVGTNLDRRDLSGRSFVSLHVHQGLGEALGGMDDDSTLSSRSFGGADNNFTKVVGSFTRLQSLHPRLYVLLQLSGQYAAESLVAGEQIVIGGANTVRGHPQSIYAGDDGFVANIEARYSVLPNDSRYQLAAFIDHGEVHTKEPIIGQDDWNRISGGGVGGRATLFDDLELRVDLAAPIGDKTDDDFYVYAQARYRF